MESNYKTLSVLLLGMVIGMGYSMACSTAGDFSTNSSGGMPNIPGVSTAAAQSGSCARWEVAVFDMFYLESGDPSGADGTDNLGVRALPAGWLPVTGRETNGIWASRCAQ